MKLRNFFVVLALGCLSTGFTSCSDDDDDEFPNGGGSVINPNYADATIAGFYQGTLTTAVGGENSKDLGLVATLGIQENGKFKLVLPEQFKAVKGMTMPSVTVNDLEFVKSDTAKAVLNVDSISVNVGKSIYIIINLHAVIKNDNLSMSYELKPGAMPMYINFSFTGDKTETPAPAPSVNVPEAEGKYFGMGTESVMGDTGVDSTYYTNIVAQEGGKFTVTLPESTVKDTTSSMFMPTIELKDLVFEEGENNHFVIARDTIVVETTEGKKATISNLNIDFDATKKTVSFAYGLQYGRMPLTISYTFTTLQKNDFVCGDFLGVNSYTMGKETSADSASFVSILPQENGKYTVVFPESGKEKAVTSRGMEMPRFSLKDVEVVAKENTFSFNIETASVDVTQADGTNITVALSNVNATIFNNKLEMTYSMQPGRMPFALGYTYKGIKQIKK